MSLFKTVLIKHIRSTDCICETNITYISSQNLVESVFCVWNSTLAQLEVRNLKKSKNIANLKYYWLSHCHSSFTMFLLHSLFAVYPHPTPLNHWKFWHGGQFIVHKFDVGHPWVNWIWWVWYLDNTHKPTISVNVSFFERTINLIQRILVLWRKSITMKTVWINSIFSYM